MAEANGERRKTVTVTLHGHPQGLVLNIWGPAPKEGDAKPRPLDKVALAAGANAGISADLMTEWLKQNEGSGLLGLVSVAPEKDE